MHDSAAYDCSCTILLHMLVDARFCCKYMKMYESAAYEKFANATAKFNVPMLPSIILLKSGDMARFFNEKVPGITVPDDLIKEMDAASTPEEKRAKSIEIAARTIRELRPLCQGVHLIAAGWESSLPQVIEQSKI